MADLGGLPDSADPAPPFGAQVMSDGRVLFRLWAPAASRVGLHLPDRQDTRSMTAREDGWHVLVASDTPSGTPYAFRLPDGLTVPDPASRGQLDGVHGPSLVVDPRVYDWQTPRWHGRPWRETVLYELHVGTFTPEGTFAAAADKLEDLAALGVTAVELMPVAAFGGQRGWGYDGVLLFAPHRAYGTPDELRAFVDRAHGLGLSVLLDVVYNHFGPDGNYLGLYAPAFFDGSHATPWGPAIDMDVPEVRAFFVQNALYWLREYRMDGLRFDAVNEIRRGRTAAFLPELSGRLRTEGPTDRPIHLVLENDDNAVSLLAGPDEALFDAQWNDDFHHAAHALLTGEREGYYADHAEDPVGDLSRSLAEGFVQQGRESVWRGRARGAPSGHLPPQRFVNFLQNHDQVGNRGFGDRLVTLAEPAALQALTAILLLAPQVPMLFMGEEHGERRPFLFFCDFELDLAKAVHQGRRREHAAFTGTTDKGYLDRLPDPNDTASFAASIPAGERDPDWMAFHHHLLALRRDVLLPALGDGPLPATQKRWAPSGLRVDWLLPAGGQLAVLANLGPDTKAPPPRPDLPLLFDWPSGGSTNDPWPAWAVAWYLRPEGAVPMPFNAEEQLP